MPVMHRLRIVTIRCNFLLSQSDVFTVLIRQDTLGSEQQVHRKHEIRNTE